MALHATPARVRIPGRAVVHTATLLTLTMLATVITMIALVDSFVPVDITADFNAVLVRLMWILTGAALAGITLGGLHRPTPGRHRR